MTRVIRGVGWTLVAAGAVILLYVVYLLWFTGLETARGQQALQEQFEAPRTAVEVDDRDDGGDQDAVEVGDAYAAVWFERDGDPIVVDDPLFVVEGTSLEDLRHGPGHYVSSAAPGEEGNLAIAGHRTTYGSPFGELAELQDGDTIHVLDRHGEEWVYAYREQRVVLPTDTWVVREPDPIGLEAPTITLTTCHPRFSAAQRLIAWGELIGDPKPAPTTADGDDDASLQADGAWDELAGEG